MNPERSPSPTPSTTMPTATPPSPATPLPSSATTLYDFDLTSADPADKSKTRTLSRPPSLETIPASHSNAISPAKAEEALGRQDAAVGSGGEWMAPPIGRANTVELDGRLFPTRSGRGAELGEPLTDVRTREQLVYIDWPDGDPENPFNFPSRRKWAIVVTCITITSLTALNATAYSSGLTSARDTFGQDMSQIVWTVGNTVYLLAIAFTPLALAPLSEVLGRNTIYLVTSALFFILFIPQALSPNIGGIIAARFVQGCCASVGNSMVGGTIADLFLAKTRGLAMSLYSLWVFWGQALGPAVFAWVNQEIGFRWMFWLQTIIGFLSFVTNFFVLQETRGSLLLSKRALALTKKTGKPHAAPGDLERGDLKTLIQVSISRPIRYLFTEPIVAAISLWVAFAWGVLFLFISSSSLIFRQFGLGIGLSGTILLSIGIGASIGFALNLYQEKIYHKACRKSPDGKAEPEVRLWMGSVGALIFPIGIFIYAWTGRPGLSWVGPAIGLVVVNVGVFLIYSGVFSYLADAYERYSSSAQAAQSLMRNSFAGIFPLFAFYMYEGLTYPWASTLLGCVALLLGLCPLILLTYGKRIRLKSKVASALLAEAREADAKRARAAAERKEREKTVIGRRGTVSKQTNLGALSEAEREGEEGAGELEEDVIVEEDGVVRREGDEERRRREDGEGVAGRTI